jgi:SAM-dependent methyltransferase
VAGTDELARFYEDAYTRDAADAELYGRWRALSAAGKADHVVAVCSSQGLAPASTLDVGCGDGALLSELHRRGFGGRLEGVEIAPAAVEIARGRPEIAAVQLYDGARLPHASGSFELGVLSHVLEHVADPVAVLSETARVCAAVVVEVPLEANWSARRESKLEHAAEVGHIQRLGRDAVHGIAAGAGMRVAAELQDPLPRSVQRFFARTPSERARADARWAVRASLHRLSPALARRVFTVHFACLLVR